MRKFLTLILCMLLLGGCTQSNIVNPDEQTIAADPDFEAREGIEIDWTQVSRDAEEIFADEKSYPYSRDFHFYLEPTKKEIMLMWVVADDLPDSEIRNYAEDLIKGFNDVVAIQDFSIESSGKDSYGGLWDQYGLSFSIVPETTQEDEESWFITGAYAAGVDFVLPDTSTLISQTEGAEGEETAAPEETKDSGIRETSAAQGPGKENAE